MECGFQVGDTVYIADELVLSKYYPFVNESMHKFSGVEAVIKSIERYTPHKNSDVKYICRLYGLPWNWPIQTLCDISETYDIGDPFDILEE